MSSAGITRVADPHPTLRNPIDGSQLVLVPGGDYLSGEPEHEEILEVEPFYLASLPVTNQQYLRFCSATAHPRPHFSGRRFSVAQAPVVGVSWADAWRYAEWAGMRLPSEWEWEKAAVVAARPVEEVARIAWYRDNSGGAPRPVGRLEPNRLGLYDLLGNVWEWTADYYDDARLYRCVRGGSWLTVKEDVRATHRDFNPPVERMNCVGFRCAMSVAGGAQ